LEEVIHRVFWIFFEKLQNLQPWEQTNCTLYENSKAMKENKATNLLAVQIWWDDFFVNIVGNVFGVPIENFGNQTQWLHSKLMKNNEKLAISYMTHYNLLNSFTYHIMGESNHGHQKLCLL
jgi:hypothetical protein